MPKAKVLLVVLAVLYLAIPAVADDSHQAFCWLRDAAFRQNAVMLLCGDGRLLASRDAGASWASYTISRGSTFNALTFVDDKRGFAAGEDGLVMETHDGGQTWKTVDAGTSQYLTAVSFSGENGWIAGYDGVILHSADGGHTWQKQAEFENGTIDSLYFLDQNRGWAVGWAGLIARTSDGGRTWEQIKVPELDLQNLESVYFRDALNGWAVGSTGLIVKTSDGGKTWERQKSPTEVNLTSIAFDASGRGWIAADYDLLQSDDQGRSWKVSGISPPGYVQKVGVQANGVWAMGLQYFVDRKQQDADWHEEYSYKQSLR